MHDRAAKKPMETDLKPFMNLMVVLIPMLLASAEFARVAVIDVHGHGGTNSDTTQTDRTQSTSPILVLLSDSTITIGTDQGFLPSFFYETISISKPARSSAAMSSTRQQHAMQELEMVACDSSGRRLTGLYSRAGELLIEPQANTVEPSRNSAAAKMKLYGAVQRPLAVTDMLSSKLAAFIEHDGGRSSVIIAADRKVTYEKVVACMDAVRKAGYHDLSIAKPREI